MSEQGFLYPEWQGPGTPAADGPVPLFGPSEATFDDVLAARADTRAARGTPEFGRLLDAERETFAGYDQAGSRRYEAAHGAEAAERARDLDARAWDGRGISAADVAAAREPSEPDAEPEAGG